LFECHRQLVYMWCHERNIEAIDHSFKEMVLENSQGRLGSQADLSFHMAIAYASRNPLHIMIIRNFYDPIFFGIKETLESVYADFDNIQKIMDQHGQIVTAIKQGSSEQAAEAMKSHILFLINFINLFKLNDRNECAFGAEGGDMEKVKGPCRI